MRTEITESVSEAAAFIKDGGIVAFPTETVYGLGADAFNRIAIRKVFAAKGRPNDNPLIVHVSAPEQIALVAESVPPVAEKLIAGFFPGALTVVLPKSDSVPREVTAGLSTVAVRMPDHEKARAFIKACGGPLVAPSANVSGRPSPTTAESVLEDLDGQIDCLLKGNPTKLGLESTVVDCTGDSPIVLRTGSLAIEELRKVAPEITQIENNSDLQSRSPGLRHKHYSPTAEVRVITAKTIGEIPPRSSFIGLSQFDASFELERICESTEEYARLIYEFFRESDRRGIKRIYCEAVDEKGIGVALMDRILRAAAK